jgi:NAD(P)-dependent dehydrogenase (short-subunit alcohol dehydrogenase family)
MKKVAIVSGATSGIGLAVVRRLCDAGFTVIGYSRKPEKAAGVLAELTAKHGGETVEFRALDACDVNAVRNLVKDVQARHGRIDLVVNAAGSMKIERSDAVGEESFDAQVDSIFKGTFFLSTAAAVVMAQQKSGLVISIGSVVAELASPKMAAYASAKAAVVMLTKSFAVEYAASGVRFLCVSPGLVDTPLWDKTLLQMMATKAPLKKPASPDEIAALIVQLATTDAPQLTGTNIIAGGGMGI